MHLQNTNIYYLYFISFSAELHYTLCMSRTTHDNLEEQLNFVRYSSVKKFNVLSYAAHVSNAIIQTLKFLLTTIYFNNVY